jgi:hypothetical protein
MARFPERRRQSNHKYPGGKTWKNAKWNRSRRTFRRALSSKRLIVTSGPTAFRVPVKAKARGKTPGCLCDPTQERPRFAQARRLAVSRQYRKKRRTEMAVEPTAPCPHCKAENMAHRRECWRCKRTLPTSFALDAQMRAGRRPPADQEQASRPTRADVEEALDQAIIIDESEARSSFAQEGGGFGKRLLWLFRKHTESA